MIGGQGGGTGLDDEFIRAVFDNLGVDHGAEHVRSRTRVLAGRLVDELHLAIAPVLMGQGERLFDGTDLAGLGFTVTRHALSAHVMHTVLTRSDNRDRS